MEIVQTSDNFFMRQAILEAEKAFSLGEVPIGAVLVCDGRIVCRAHNMVETLQDPTAHAEMQVITSATANLGAKYLPQCTLYVTVEPCVMCAGACNWSQLGGVVYGASDPKKGCSTFADNLFHPKTKLTAGVLSEECSEIMTRFFKKLR